MKTARFSRRATRLTAGAILAFVAIIPSRAEPKPDIAKLQPGAIAISAAPIAKFDRTGGAETKFGKLTFRGGLVLTAPGNVNFGGWSGLVLDPDAKGFASVSDSGVWLTGTLTYDSGGQLSGVTGARIGPLLAQDGHPLKRGRDRDGEALALVSGSARNGSALVSFEQNARIARYDISPNGFSPALGFLPKPKSTQAMRRNNGLEAMTVMRGGPFKGAAIAMSERLLDRARNHTGWIWTGSEPQDFHLTNIGDFDVTDIASQEDGTLFVLERRFRWLEGVKMRLRRINAADLEPGKTADGEILIEANLENEIDNMEGLALTRSASGETIITMISDDNFNHFLQRTVLLQFALAATQTVKARPQQ